MAETIFGKVLTNVLPKAHSGDMETTTSTETRICHNCGRRQDHRWHDREPDPDFLLSNGCPAFMARPETLWRAVLQPAILEAAAAHGVDSTQAYGDLARRAGRWT